METIISEEIQKNPVNTAITTTDMVAWWTKNGDGNFNWSLYHKIVNAKRYMADNISELKNIK